MYSIAGRIVPNRSKCAIGIMAKLPRAGHSKTRLCPPLQPEQAAQLSAAFLRDTSDNLILAARSVPITGYAAYAPAGTEAALRPYLAPATYCVVADGVIEAPPGVDGFGRCLLHAIQALFARDHAAACVLSSDTPTLPTDSLVQAARTLLAADDRRIVLGACTDGGYYLLGMRAPHAGLFTDIEWSTDNVAAATRERAAALGLDVVELPLWYDVDDAEGLERLVTDYQGYTAPRTRDIVEALGVRTLLSAAHA